MSAPPSAGFFIASATLLKPVQAPLDRGFLMLPLVPETSAHPSSAGVNARVG